MMRSAIFGTLFLISAAILGFAVLQFQSSNRNTETVQQIVNSEELVLELTPKFKTLSRSVLNLQLPDPISRDLFADSIVIEGDLKRKNEAANQWQIDHSIKSGQPGSIVLWKDWFDACAYFENAKFYIIKGEFDESNPNRFSTLTGFDALAVGIDGKYNHLKLELDIEWLKSDSDNKEVQWKICNWNLGKLKIDEESELFFVDELAKRIAPYSVIERARRSKHEELTARLINGGEYFLADGVEYPFFFPDVTLEHPGVTIVDIDQDGLEDIYVCMQYGSNLLFHNQGDGTFVEAAQKFGLDIDGDCTASIFADFDNDGDPDCFIGRGRHPSLYMVNFDGTFTSCKGMVKTPLPSLVSSISATDFNCDGLLDIYISTYGPVEPAEVIGNSNPRWVEMFLTPDQVQEFHRRNSNAHKFLAQTGPPNLLLQNIGDGEFRIADVNQSIENWKMTFQSTWHDFDRDGDPDLYVANDFNRDHFFRNDRDEGFTEVTAELGLDEMGFGMGVSFGDFDNDGRFDVYVSNMFSKAGRRILSQVEGIDPRLKEMAAGNFLYRAKNSGYELVSGFGDSKIQVAKAGWSWGGQFTDFNNDGFQDIYVVNGYYTAPDNVAIDVDL